MRQSHFGSDYSFWCATWLSNKLYCGAFDLAELFDFVSNNLPVQCAVILIIVCSPMLQLCKRRMGTEQPCCLLFPAAGVTSTVLHGQNSNLIHLHG